MEILAGDLDSWKIFVNDELRNIKCFWPQFEFSMNINDPLQQESSLSVFELSLELLDVVMWRYEMDIFLD